MTDRAEIRSELAALAERVTADVVALNRSVLRVAIVVRTASFFTRTRVTKLAVPTQDAATVTLVAIGLLDKFDLTRPVRLLGVRADLTAPPPID